MREDIEKFRKLCQILTDGSGWSRHKIVVESKISEPTLKKILEEPIEEMKLRSSVLALMQDFIRAKKDEFMYAGIEYKPSPETKEYENDSGKPPKDDTKALIEAIVDLAKKLPDAVSVTICFNGNKA